LFKPTEKTCVVLRHLCEGTAVDVLMEEFVVDLSNVQINRRIWGYWRLCQV